MVWRANKDDVVKDPTNGNIVVTLTITNGRDVTITDKIPGNNLTDEDIAHIAALRIDAYEERERAYSKIRPGSVLPKKKDDNSLAIAWQRLATAQQKATLLATSTDPDVIAAQNVVKALLAQGAT